MSWGMLTCDTAGSTAELEYGCGTGEKPPAFCDEACWKTLAFGLGNVSHDASSNSGTCNSWGGFGDFTRSFRAEFVQLPEWRRRG